MILLAASWFPLAPWLAERLLFFPDPTDPGPAPVLAGVEGRDVVLRTADGVSVHGWWHGIPDAPTVLLLHGNAGNIAGRVPLAAAYLSRGVSTFMLDYRGYGRSEGSPSERGVHDDALAALDFLDREVGLSRVTVHGRSLGAAVAAPAVGEREVAGVVLEAGFTSLAEIARAVYPVIPPLLLRPLAGRFDTRAAVPSITVPILVVHGTNDELVPIEMGRSLYEAAPEPKEWYPVEGAGHNDVFVVGGDGYFDRLADFAREVPGYSGGTGPSRVDPNAL